MWERYELGGSLISQAWWQIPDVGSEWWVKKLDSRAQEETDQEANHCLLGAMEWQIRPHVAHLPCALLVGTRVSGSQ